MACLINIVSIIWNNLRVQVTIGVREGSIKLSILEIVSNDNKYSAGRGIN